MGHRLNAGIDGQLVPGLTSVKGTQALGLRPRPYDLRSLLTARHLASG